MGCRRHSRKVVTSQSASKPWIGPPERSAQWWRGRSSQTHGMRNLPYQKKRSFSNKDLPSGQNNE